MWSLIRIVFSAGLALMVLSFLLGGLFLPVVALPEAALAQNTHVLPEVFEEAVQPPPPVVSASDTYHMPESERLIVPSAAPEEVPVATHDLIATMTLTQQEALGSLSLETGGFAEDVWQGIRRERAEMLLHRIRSQGLRSKTAKGLLKRLLLTQAIPPEGPSSQHWLAVRAETLQAMGFAHAAHQLLNTLGPMSMGADDLAQIWTDDKLITGATPQACAHIQESIHNTDAPYWQQGLLVCKALQGALDELRLAFKLVSPQERAGDELFYKLLESILNGTPSPRLALTDIFTPRHVALYQGYPELINPEVMRRLPDVSLRRLVRTPALDVRLRLQAAEKLVNDFGTPEDVVHLVALYEEVAFDRSMVEAPLKFAQQELDGSKARALLWQAAGAADLASGKALALKILWERAEKDFLVDLPGYLLPAQRQIAPGRNLAWFSPYVIKMALREGNLPTAQAWWEVLSGNRSLSRDLTVERTDIAMAFAMLDGHLPESVLDKWWSTQPLHTQESRLKTTRTLAIFEALDLQIPYDIWTTIHHEFNDAHVDTRAGPGPIWLRLVGSTLEKGHTGEAILMLLEPVMYAHPIKMPPQGVANIVAGLFYLGLNTDAKALALEAMIKGEQAPL